MEDIIKPITVNDDFVRLLYKPTIFPIIMMIPQITRAIDLLKLLNISPATISHNINYLVDQGFITKTKIVKGYTYSLSHLGHRYRYHLVHMMILYEESRSEWKE